jgi:hypothetical protein
MKRYSRRHAVSDSGISLGDRLLSAVLTPLFFNISLVIFAALVSRRGRMLGELLYMYAAPGLGMLMFVALPAIVGFLAGSSGTAKLLGHAFLTHGGSERNIILTLLVWAAFAMCFYVALDTLPE